MFIQTQKTPNPNSLKFLPGIKISNVDSVEFLNKDQTDNYLIRDILHRVTLVILSLLVSPVR